MLAAGAEYVLVTGGLQRLGWSRSSRRRRRASLRATMIRLVLSRIRLCGAQSCGA